MPRKSANSPKPKSLRGAPEYEPTIHQRSKVIEFICAGFRQADIAMYLDISEETLVKHFKAELNQSLMHRSARLSRNVYLDALKGCKQSRSFWLTHRGGWSAAKSKDDENYEEARRKTQEALTGIVNAAADVLKGHK